MWQYFSYITFSTIGLWIVSAIFLYAKKPALNKIAVALHISATLFIGIFITALWLALERPPLRTLAETRIWYTFFIGSIGLVVYVMYKQKWMLNYAALMATVFILITYFKPDTMNKTLMPALQSVWFIPHVVVYIFAYAMLGMATATAMYGLYQHKRQGINIFSGIKYRPYSSEETAVVVNRLVNIGYAFLTFGLLFGALWAKEAWGHYWTWDPKETWAFISWLGYLIYIHYRQKDKGKKAKTNYIIIIIAFILLMICWFGVNYLPTAQMSVHTYSG